MSDHNRERIGNPAEVWATRYTDGWTVYGIQSGVIIRKVTREKAEEILANFAQARTRHPSTGGAK